MARMPKETVAVNPDDYFDPRVHRADDKGLPPMDRVRVQLDEIRERKRLAQSGGSKTLDDVKQGPLGTLRNLLLRNANSPDRLPPRDRYRRSIHGTADDLPPTFGLPTRPALEDNATQHRDALGDASGKGTGKMPRGQYYDPTEERGVAELERTMPHRLRPSDAMRRFSLFTMPPMKMIPSQKGEKWGGAQHRWTYQQSQDPEAASRAVEQPTQATAQAQGLSDPEGDDPSRDEPPASGLSGPYDALLASSRRLQDSREEQQRHAAAVALMGTAGTGPGLFDMVPLQEHVRTGPRDSPEQELQDTAVAHGVRFILDGEQEQEQEIQDKGRVQARGRGGDGEGAMGGSKRPGHALREAQGSSRGRPHARMFDEQAAAIQRKEAERHRGRGRQDPSHPLHRPNAGEIGTSGVSQLNRRGDTRAAPNYATREGSGMIRGTLSVGYEAVREATACARRFGSILDTRYMDDFVELQMVFMPEFYEPFVAGMQGAIGSSFHFAPEVSPPLFVAQIGKSVSDMKSEKGARVVGGQEQGQEKKQGRASTASAQPAASCSGGAANSKPSNASNLQAAAATPQPAPNPSAAQGTSGGRHVTPAAQLFKLKELQATEQMQVLVDERFRELASKGAEHDLRTYMKWGAPVEVDAPDDPQEDVEASKLASRVGPSRTRKRSRGKKSAAQEMLTDRRKRVQHLEKERRAMIRMGGPAPEDQRPRVYPALDGQDEEGHTALMLAASHGHPAAVRMLLGMGAKASKRNNKGRSALDLARLQSNAASLALSLHAQGAADRKKRAGQCVVLLDQRSLLQCAKDGDLRKVRRHIDHLGESPNLTNRYGQTPLHFAAMNRDLPMVQFLVSRGADLGRKNNLGQSPDVLLGDEEDRELKEALLQAVHRGQAERRKQESRERQLARAQQERVMKEERALRQLRALTRGTTAARSVFPALRERERERERGAGAGQWASEGSPQLQQQSSGVAPLPFLPGGHPESAPDRAKRLAASHGSMGGSMVAMERARSKLAHKGRKNGGGIGLLGGKEDVWSTAGLDKDPALQLSWTRHATRFADSMARARQAQVQRRRVRGALQEGRGEMTAGATAYVPLEGDLRVQRQRGVLLATVHAPELEAKSQAPDPRDPAFEAWFAMRFGTVAEEDG